MYGQAAGLSSSPGLVIAILCSFINPMFIYHIPDMDQELEIRPRKLEVTPISPSRRRVSETITKKVLEYRATA